MSPLSQLARRVFAGTAKAGGVCGSTHDDDEDDDDTDSVSYVFGDFDTVPKDDLDQEKEPAAAAGGDRSDWVSVDQFEKVGNQLYELIHHSQPVMAAKITGMLLENELEDLEALLADPAGLDATVEQAVRVLRETMLVEQHWAHLITQPSTRSPLRGKPLHDALAQQHAGDDDRFNTDSRDEADWIREQEHMARAFYSQEEYERYCVVQMETGMFRRS